MPQSTKSKGDDFENEVAGLLRYLPNADVQQHEIIAGKNVDIICRIRGGIAGGSTIAIECKDHSRPLTREQVAKETADYLSLTTNGHVDKFYFVTRNGVVANARAALNGKTQCHFTFREIEDLVIHPQVLIDNMIRQFEIDDLDKGRKAAED